MNRTKLLKMMVGEQARRLYSNYANGEFSDGVRKITMCHAKTRNSLSISMMETLIRELNQDRDNFELRAIVIAADGPIFSAGHNLKELTQEAGKTQHTKVFNLATALMNSIIDHPVPIIAKVDGLAAAAGCQLIAQCDIVICSKESKFSTPGANFGVFCSTPGIALARAVPKATALKMLLTGEAIDANEACSSGLVTAVCEKNELDDVVAKYIAAIKTKSRSIIELGKRFYYKQIYHDIKKAYVHGADLMIENINSKDGIEGIKSFVEKRQPKWSHS